MQITPYEFQEADILALLEHDLTGVMAMETGAGKTVIAAAAAQRSGAKTKLIIAPQGVHEKVWRSTITGHENDDPDSEHYGEWITGLDPEARVQVIGSSDAGKAAMADLEFEVPGYYLMTPQLFTRWKPHHLRVDLTLVDEFHLLGNRKARGGQELVKFRRRTGAATIMSGTMWRNKFENALTAMRFVYPHRDSSGDIADSSAQRWIDNFCETKADYRAPNGIEIVGELVPGRLASLADCWLQHFKRLECCEFHPEGFLHDVPEPIVIRESIELLPEQKKMMTQMQRDYLAYLDVATAEWQALPEDERKKKALVTKLPIVRSTRLSQMTLAVPSIVPRPWKPKSKTPGTAADWELQPGFIIAEDGLTKQAVDDRGFPLWDVVFAPDAPSPKLDALMRICREQGEPVVAATNSQKFAELAVNRLNAAGLRAFGWWGTDSSGRVLPQKTRDEALVAFKRGEYDIIVGVTEAIGTGIDGLQDASGVLVSLNKSRDLASETQLEGRLDRRGQKRKDGVIHFELIATGSMDEDIIDTQLERRLKLNRSLQKAVRQKRSSPHDR